MPKTNRLTMKSIPIEDRPTEKMCRLGSTALTDAELLAVIIRSGTKTETALALSQRLLSATQSVQPDKCEARKPEAGLRRLIDLSIEELQAFGGIGQVRATQIKAALELGNRILSHGAGNDRRVIKAPDDAISLLESDMRFLSREEFRAILLDIRNRIIRISSISAGSLNASIVHPRDLFREAVKANAAAIILAHNHPSGDSAPSKEDIETTKRFMEIGEMMGVRVVDHIVIAHAGSVSLRQLGLI